MYAWRSWVIFSPVKCTKSSSNVQNLLVRADFHADENIGHARLDQAGDIRTGSVKGESR